VRVIRFVRPPVVPMRYRLSIASGRPGIGFRSDPTCLCKLRIADYLNAGERRTNQMRSGMEKRVMWK